MGRGGGGGGCGGGCGGGGWHWAGAFNHKLGARLRRGTVYGRGQPGVSGGRVGRAGVQGRAEVGPTSRWATQEGHVDPVHGQRRKVAKNKSKKVKGEGKRGRRNTFLIEYTLYFHLKVK